MSGGFATLKHAADGFSKLQRRRSTSVEIGVCFVLYMIFEGYCSFCTDLPVDYLFCLDSFLKYPFYQT